jgi:prepilin-type processing-associated H-X9-DG protein
MEQQSRYESIIYFVHPGSFPAAYGRWRSCDSQQPIRGTIPTICCPSDNNAKANDTEMTRTNYVYSLGDAINDNRWMTNSSAVGGRSAFVKRGWKNLAAITDGTSNTIAASETKAAKTNNDREAGLASMNGITGLDTNPRDCLNHLDSVKKFYKSTYTYALWSTTATTYCAWRGYHAFYSYGPNPTGFCTVLPPNTANCSSAEYDNWGVYSASSRHSGGVNGALFDGSVRFGLFRIRLTASQQELPRRNKLRTVPANLEFGERWDQSPAVNSLLRNFWE